MIDYKKRLTIIDADTIIYLSSFNKKDAKEKTVSKVLKLVDDIIKETLDVTRADEYLGFLTNGSFRYNIAKTVPYKGNRKDTVQPKYYKVIKEYMIAEYKFTMQKDYEADDLCTSHFMHYKDIYDCIIASPDKDLKQVEGLFYDYKKKQYTKVSDIDAIRNFWVQMLWGDAGDNIKGITGLGEVKSNKFVNSVINSYKDEDVNEIDFQLSKDIFEIYLKEEKGKERFFENLDLLGLLKKFDGDEDQGRSFIKLATPIPINSEISELELLEEWE